MTTWFPLLRSGAALLFSIGVMAGCERTSKAVAQINDYQERVFRLLNREQPELNLKLPAYPALRDLRQQVSEVHIDWSDFFDLDRCRLLQRQIAERNSPIGKVMEPATQLLYEARLVQNLRRCQRQTGRDVNQAVEAARELKEAQWPMNLWNNTWASHYIKGVMSYTNYRDMPTSEQISRLSDAFRFLRMKKVSNIGSETPLNSEKWYEAYQVLESSKGLIGGLIIEMNTGLIRLQQTTRAIRRETKRVCPQNVKTRKAEYLINVLIRYFIPGVQQRQTQIIFSVQALERELAAWLGDERFDTHLLQPWESRTLALQGPATRSEQWLAATREHIETWLGLYHQCGIAAPGVGAKAQ